MYLIDYLEHELSSFDERPLGPVDSAALSQFCMVDGATAVGGWQPRGTGMLGLLADRWRAWQAPRARFSDLFRAELFDGMFRGLTPDLVKRELAALVASPRFRDLALCDYTSLQDEEARVQFAACSFVWRGAGGRDFGYVGFRGTDVSFVGWRENFDMAVHPPVPAQKLAVSYLESVAGHLPERLFVGGHSKGGNLATYASLRCSDAVRGRIERVFDHDGPGFKAGFMSEGDYGLLAGRIHRTVPEEDVVGMLMESHAPTLVVRSSAHGMDAHSIFTWEVDPETGDFSYADGLADSALFMRDVFSEWLAALTEDELPNVVEALFDAIAASGAQGAGQLFAGGSETLGLLAEASRNMDQQTRDVLLPALAMLAAIAARRGLAGALQRR